MNSPKDSIFIRALYQNPVPRTPIWLMRQAGRYLPEYRAVRAKAGDFLRLCKNPDWATEVTLQPLARYPLDAAILFSDILTIPDALGLGLYFEEGEGPRFRFPIQTPKAMEELPALAVAEALSYVFAAAKSIRQSLPSPMPLIGFSGSPWTLACYMIEGKSSKDFAYARSFLSAHPTSMQILLTTLSSIITEYLCLQIEAGANAVMLFDTWGGLLSFEQYTLFSLQFMQQIVTALKKKHAEVPVILFTKGGGEWLDAMANTGCCAVSLDWNTHIGKARMQVGDRVALQGNLNPAILLESDDIIRSEVARILQEYGHGSGHIFNLGHGVRPEISPDKVQVLVTAVQELSQVYHNE